MLSFFMPLFISIILIIIGFSVKSGKHVISGTVTLVIWGILTIPNITFILFLLSFLFLINIFYYKKYGYNKFKEINI